MSLFTVEPRRIYVLMLSMFVLAVFTAPAFAVPEYIWQRNAVGELSDTAKAITTDTAGYVIITGGFTNSLRFDSINVTGRRVDIYVAKYNPDGVIQWVQTAGSPYSNELAWDVATDRSDSIYITGQFENDADFGSIRLSTAGQSDIFVAKYNAAGAIQWARRAGGVMGRDRIVGSPDAGRGIAVDRSGNVYVTGYFRTTADFSGTSIVSAGETDIFLAKYNTNGELLWVNRAGGVDRDAGLSVAVDRAGNAYVGGNVSGMAEFSGSRILASSNDFFVAKYRPGGRLAWVKHIPNSDGGSFRKIRVSPDNHIFIVGGFAGTIRIDGITLRSRDYPGLPRTDAIVAKLDTDGVVQWANRGGGYQNDFASDVGFERSGNVFVIGDFVGEYSESAEFDGIMLSGAVGENEVFIGEYQSDGFLLEVDKANERISRFSPTGISLADNRNEQIYITGSGSDIFISKLRARPLLPADDECETGVDSVGRPCVLSPWQHIHWRCTRDIRRALGEPELLCPGVFENGPAPKSAEDIWYIERTNKALESETAEDFYQVTLPDPASALENGHPDIRSSEDIISGGDPQPLVECGAVERTEFGIAGRSNRIYVSVTGMLNIKVEPQRNSRSRRALNPAGESIAIYRGETRDDSLATGGPLSKTIICPRSDPAEVRSGKGLRDVRFSFGERGGERDAADTGGYRLDIEYVIKAVRGIPDWVLSHLDERLAGVILPLPCANGLGGFGSANFPYCGNDIPGVIEVPLPFDPQDNCIADGPGCWGVFSFLWPYEDLPFRMEFIAAGDISFELFDVNKNLIASAGNASAQGRLLHKPIVSDAIAQESSQEAKIIAVDKLAKGQYFLFSNGKPGKYSIRYTLPEQMEGPQDASLRVAALLIFIIVLALIVGRLLARK